jgi:hypothetical protein
MYQRDPIQSMAQSRHEFGEHGGVNMSIEASTTFTVLEPDTMPKIEDSNFNRDVRPVVEYRKRSVAGLLSWNILMFSVVRPVCRRTGL